jgi:hypothetical protein
LQFKEKITLESILFVDILFFRDSREKKMASEEAMKKMIEAIVDVRRKLGIPAWGQVSIHEVIERLNQYDGQEVSPPPPCEESKSEPE